MGTKSASCLIKFYLKINHKQFPPVKEFMVFYYFDKIELILSFLYEPPMLILNQKGDCFMKALNNILDYIETQLTDTINEKEIERLANVSYYNFQKMFLGLTGMTLSEYTRKRKLSRSIADLQYSNDRIIDIAFKYGYQSSEAYTRAFQNLFNQTPSAVRKAETPVTLFPKLKIRIQLEGDVPMNYHIIKKEKITVQGFTRHYDNDEVAQTDIPKFWDWFNESEEGERLLANRDTTQPNQVLGICIPKEGNGFDYMIATYGLKETELETKTFEISPSSWLVFEAQGVVPDALRKTYQDIYQVFFPSSQLKPAKLPDFEAYPLDQDPTSPSHITEIWIPIQ